MSNRHAKVRRCAVYQGRGEPVPEASEWTELVDTAPRRRTIADTVPIRQIMSNVVLCARPDLHIASVLQLMIANRLGCLPVVDERRRPIGIITKLDLVEQLEAAMRAAGAGMVLPTDIQARTAEEVMMPLALTLTEEATVAHAASLMISEDTHHVLIVSNAGTLVGVVSTRDVTAWLVDNDQLYGSEASAGAADPLAFDGFTGWKGEAT